MRLQVARTLPEQISQYAQVVLQTLAYAGTGDVLQIQSLLAMCGEHTEVDESAAWKARRLRIHLTRRTASCPLTCAASWLCKRILPPAHSGLPLLATPQEHDTACKACIRALEWARQVLCPLTHSSGLCAACGPFPAFCCEQCAVYGLSLRH